MNKLFDFLKDKKKFTEFLYILGFITSGVFTLLLMTSNSVDLLSKALGASMTLVLECGKGYCFLESLHSDKHSPRMKSVLFGLWIFLMLLSIFASQAFLMNETNKIDNINSINSIEYQQLQDKQERLKDQISVKKDLLSKTTNDKSTKVQNISAAQSEINKQIDSYNADIKSYQVQINTKNAEMKKAIAKGFAGQTDRLKSEIGQLQSNINSTTQARDNLKVSDNSNVDLTTITSLNNEIDNINSDLNTIDFAGIKGTKSENGYIALLSSFAEMIGTSTQTVAFALYLCINCVFEILICTLCYLNNVYNPESENSIFKKISGFGSQLSPTTAKAQTLLFDRKPKKYKQKIGFQCEKKAESIVPTGSQGSESGIKNADVKAYIDCMYRESDGSESIGYMKIASKTNLKVDVARQIKAHLGYKNIVETIGTKTMILKSQDEAKKNLDGGLSLKIFQFFKIG